mmetsp:Transcript_25004/g.87162  ORF Transcript_25004/g.87162 Transcript_25004/m.87162 type:complete len:257 (-) Transcript_25004:726-1496(-)
MTTERSHEARDRVSSSHDAVAGSAARPPASPAAAAAVPAPVPMSVENDAYSDGTASSSSPVSVLAIDTRSLATSDVVSGCNGAPSTSRSVPRGPLPTAANTSRNAAGEPVQAYPRSRTSSCTGKDATISAGSEPTRPASPPSSPSRPPRRPPPAPPRAAPGAKFATTAPSEPSIGIVATDVSRSGCAALREAMHAVRTFAASVNAGSVRSKCSSACNTCGGNVGAPPGSVDLRYFMASPAVAAFGDAASATASATT